MTVAQVIAVVLRQQDKQYGESVGLVRVHTALDAFRVGA